LTKILLERKKVRQKIAVGCFLILAIMPMVTIAENIKDLQQFLQTISSDETIIWLGAGSNVLIADSGIDGVVICPKENLTEIDFHNNIIKVQCGVTCAKLAQFCVQHELTATEFFAGIPGTMGGALAMNAGAHGYETWDNITAVETINRHGEIKIRKPEEFQINYRHVKKPANEWFITAHFKFPQGDKERIMQQTKQIMQQRAATQPLGAATCGSVFRNPNNDYAARLIESCGLKGKQIGGARVSEKHANFIVNIGNATANDIMQLIDYMRDTVQRECGVELIPELGFMGFK
jgi:UDP-N-acetylmuramate dehydrogenase